MGVEENKAALRRFIEETNDKNLAVIDELVTPESVDHQADSFPGVAPGREGVHQVFQMIYAAFPDFHQEILDVIGEGDRAASRVTITGTHQGEFMGMPPTGKHVSVEGIDIVRFDDQGKMAEHWGLFDQMTMMMQLGMMPPPPAAGEDGQ